MESIKQKYAIYKPFNLQLNYSDITIKQKIIFLKFLNFKGIEFITLLQKKINI